MTRAHGVILAISLVLVAVGAAQLVRTHLAQVPAGSEGELRRCRDLAAAGRADIACHNVWREARRRFLGEPAFR